MKIFLKILNIFFTTLGVLFFIIIIGASYLWITDPFNLRSLIPAELSPIETIKIITGNTSVKIDNIDKNPLLSEEQEAQLESLGVDPANLPTTITPAMEECFIDKLGQSRANELINGATPNTSDFLRANSCI